jgi:hypothetical protein
MRNALGAWMTSATVAYITSYDGVIASSGNRFGDGTWYWYDSFAYAVDSAQVPGVGSGLFLFDNAKASRTTQVLLSADKPYTSDSGWSASFAYTYSRAKERMQYNGDYQFDYAFPYYSPYVLSRFVPKHRLVALGSYDAPWGFNLGAKIVVETPKPLTAFDGIGTDPPNGLNYNFLKVSQHPDDTIGFFTLDLQVTKTFEFFGESQVQIRADLLNATNRKNYATLFDGFPGKPFYFTDGDLQGVPRTVRLSFNVGF